MTSYYPTIQHSRFLKDADRSVWTVADDADLTAFPKGKIILAIEIGYNGKDTAASTYKLQWRDVTDGGSFTGGGTNGGDIAATGEVKWAGTSAVLADGTALTEANHKCTSMASTMTWQNGLENVGDNLLPDAGSLDLGSDCYTELQLALDLTDAQDGHQYEFRLWNNTSGATAGTCAAKVTTQTVTNLTVANCAHTQTAVTPTLVQKFTLALADCSQTQTLEGSLTLEQSAPAVNLEIADLVQNQVLDGEGGGGGTEEFGYHPADPGSLSSDYWSTATLNANSTAVSINPANSGALANISIWAWRNNDDTPSDLYVALYADNEGLPGALLAQSVAGVPLPVAAAADWIIASIAYDGIVADTPYWLAFYGSAGIKFRYATEAGALKCDYTHQGSWQDPFVIDVAYNEKVALFASYELPGGLSLTQQHNLTVNNALQSHIAETVALTQSHILIVGDLIKNQVITEPVLQESAGTVDLILSDLIHTLTIDTPTLIRIIGLTAADMSHSQSLEDLELSQQHQLATDNLSQGHVIAEPVLSQLHELGTQDMAHAHLLPNIALSQGQNLILTELVHGQELGEVALTQKHNLTPIDLAHSQETEAPGLSIKYILAADDLTHSHELDNVPITTASGLEINNLVIAQEFASPILGQLYILAPADSYQGQAAQAPALAQIHNLAMADLNQEQAADNVALWEAIALIVANCNQPQELAETTLAQLHNLSVQAAFLSHDLDGLLVLNQGFILGMADGYHAQTLKNCNLGYEPTEDRLLYAIEENRALAVQSESRTLIILADEVLTVTSEDRTLEMQTENRTLKVV